jgi:hypothetical protein
MDLIDISPFRGGGSKQKVDGENGRVTWGLSESQTSQRPQIRALLNNVHNEIPVVLIG